MTNAQAANLACRRCWGIIEVPAEDDQRIPLSCGTGTIARGAADAGHRFRKAAHHQLSLDLPGNFIGLHGMILYLTHICTVQGSALWAWSIYTRGLSGRWPSLLSTPGAGENMEAECPPGLPLL